MGFIKMGLIWHFSFRPGISTSIKIWGVVGRNAGKCCRDGRLSTQRHLYLGFQKVWIYPFLPSLPQTR